MKISDVRMPALVEIDECLVDFAVFLCERNLMPRNIVCHLKMTTSAFKFLEMVSDGFGGDELVSEKRTQ